MQQFERHLRALQEKLAEAGLLDKEDAFNELEAAFEELNVAEEELLQQTEEIEATRHHVERERFRYEELFEFAPDGYLVTDPLGVIVEANRAAGVLLGSQPRFLHGKPLLARVHPEDARLLRGVITEVVADGRTRVIEARLALPDHPHTLIAAMTVAARRDGGGATVGLRWMLRDVTQQVRDREQVARLNADLEQRVAERTRELESANNTKDRFLAVLSHELRTPLTPVLALVSHLAQRPDLPDDLRESMGMLRRNVELEARLIDDLLDLTRVAHDKLRLDPEFVDAHEVVARGVGLCRHDADAMRQTLATDFRAPEHGIRCDPTRIEQVVWNLVQNAVKFTPEGGRITVRTSNPAPGKISIEVLDDGIGFEPQQRARLFQPFQQGEQSAVRHFGGLGLGLSICKALVEAHGGSLAAASDGRGRGSAFTVMLPTAPIDSEPSRTSAPSRPSVADPIRPQRILLVEDHIDTAAILAKLLTLDGHDVRVANNLRVALDSASSESFDLIISDLGLPDGSGTDLLHQLRQRRNGRGSTLKAIALTGCGTEQDLKSSRDAGFLAHIVKPVDLDRLRAAIAGAAAGNHPLDA